MRATKARSAHPVRPHASHFAITKMTRPATRLGLRANELPPQLGRCNATGAASARTPDPVHLFQRRTVQPERGWPSWSAPLLLLVKPGDLRRENDGGRSRAVLRRGALGAPQRHDLRRRLAGDDGVQQLRPALRALQTRRYRHFAIGARLGSEN